MSAATDKLLPASFRGVKFFIEKAELSAGRRTQVHEYPLRDKPFVEDLGRATRTITITAFVIGSDFIEQAKALLGAVETLGSGQLVHPWLGEMKVTATAASKLAFDNRARIASITLTFTESGDLSFPSASKDKSMLSKMAADDLSVSAIQKFVDSVDVSAMSDYVQAALEGDLLDVLGVVSSSDLAAAFDLADGLADLAADALTFITRDPAVFANQLMNAVGLSRFSTSIAAWSGVAGQIRNLVKDEKLGSSTKRLSVITATGEVTSSTQRQVIQNRAAVETLTRQALLVQAVGVSTLVGTETDKIVPDLMPGTSPQEAPTYSEAESAEAGMSAVSTTSYDGIIEVRDAILETLDDEMLLSTTDAEFQALSDASVSVFEEMTERADRESRLMDVELPEVMPSQVVAYDYYADASRDLEIVARNGIENGGFCPVDLRMASQ